ncbi:hypothetical protein E2C01_012324 [Portunus trituberculatus]|uniref:Uncharacterized protein n=1 Tax=Portunus trituberculatus TaxID=210409 RepID=A0A5B7DDJ3_PORTR|nr:hypothetical protein [Portunus trituberculatus]
MSGPHLVTTGKKSQNQPWEEQEKARRMKAEIKAASSLVAADQLSSMSSSNLESQDNKDCSYSQLQRPQLLSRNQRSSLPLLLSYCYLIESDIWTVKPCL